MNSKYLVLRSFINEWPRTEGLLFFRALQQPGYACEIMQA